MSELDYVLVDSIGDRVMPTRHTRDDALDRVAKWDAFRPDQTGRYSVHKLVPVEKGGAVSDRTGWEPRPLRLDGKYPDERTRWPENPDERTRWPENPDYWNLVQVHRAATWWYWIDGQRFAVNLTTIGEPDIAGVQHPVGRVARALPVRHDGGPLLTSLFWWEGQ